MRSLLPVTTVAIIFTSTVHGTLAKAVNATADAQIHLYPFVTADCSGQPFTTPYEMKQGQCVDMNQAHSLKPRYRPDHAHWVQEVNKLHMHCKLETFSDFGCAEPNKINEYQRGHTGDMPSDLNTCMALQPQERQAGGKSTSFLSAKFVCGKVDNPEQLCTKVVKQTSWSIDPTYLAPSPSVHTATYTGSLTMSAQTTAAVEKRFDPGRESKGVWMLHPWSQSLQCFLCYPKKQHDYRKIECRAGAAYPANCGPDPRLGREGGDFLTPRSTTTKTTTKVSTIHSTTTATIQAKDTRVDHAGSSSDSTDDESSHLDIELQQKKSWHTPVKFPHPFIDGKKACADAEWEKRGQIGKDYVKIQKVHICDEKDRKDSQWIGLPPLEIRTVQATQDTTTTMLHTEIKVRHDQL